MSHASMTERVGPPLILRTVWLVGSVALAATLEGCLVAAKSCMSSPSGFLLNSMVSSQLDGIDSRLNPGAEKGDLAFRREFRRLVETEAQPNDKTQTVSLWD